MENLQKAIEATQQKNAVDFKSFIETELASRLYSTINSKKEEISKSVTTSTDTSETESEVAVSEANVLAPSAPTTGAKAGIVGSDRANSGAGEVPDPLADGLRDEIETAFGVKGSVGTVTAKDDDISLDPNFEKEFFMKEMDYKGHKVTIKQVGLGLSKPVRVYVDGNRWEFFPGPDAAVKAVKGYVDNMTTNAEEVNVDVSKTVTEKVDLDARTRLFRNTKARVEQYRKLRETKKDLDSNKQISVSEETKKLLDAVSMKNGKYMMDEAELEEDQKAYRKFFNNALKKFGVDSPVNLSPEKRKELFNYIKSNWKK